MKDATVSLAVLGGGRAPVRETLGATNRAPFLAAGRYSGDKVPARARPGAATLMR